MAQDVIDFILQEVKTKIPDASEEQLNAIEENVRSQYGGDEVYVAKKRKLPPEAKEKALQEYIAGNNLKQIKKSTGISRASLYRHMKAKK